MRAPEVHRYLDADDLADGAAARLLQRLVELQRGGRVAELCLTGGRIALAMYTRLGQLVEGSELDPERLELWWGDERFVPTGDPTRNAGPTFAVLAGHFPMDPSRTHPMPAADGVVDADASAATYAKELGETVFDICLLGMGPDGHVASVFPDHPSFAVTEPSVIAVIDSPKPPDERISLTVPALQRSREVWFLVNGADKAASVARAVAGDPALPAGAVKGRERTLWFLDQGAAADLPYFTCRY